MYATDHMDATDYESSCEAPIPFTFLYTHGSGIFQAVAFQPLDEGAGNEAVCLDEAAGSEAVAFRPLDEAAGNGVSGITASSCCPPSQVQLRNLRCGFGASNTHSPCR